MLQFPRKWVLANLKNRIMTTTEEIECWQKFLVTLDECHGKDAQSRCFVAMLKEIINRHIQRLTKESNKL